MCELIPEDMDVLITHCPPFRIGDLTARGDQAGCQDLLEVVEMTKPAVHIFGHIHEGYGVSSSGETAFINASSYNHNYQTINLPLIFEINL